MIHRLAAFAAIPAVLGFLLPAAWSPARAATIDDIELTTHAGSYLAARAADLAHDLSAAARFYQSAIEADPENPVLMERGAMLLLATDELDDAFALARRLIDIVPNNPIAHIALATRALRAGQVERAEEHLTSVAQQPLAGLTSGLLSAWTALDRDELDDVLKRVDDLTGPSWYDIFKAYHRSLILSVAGRPAEAEADAGRAYEIDNTALRVVDNYARALAINGNREMAIEVTTAFGGPQPLHPDLSVLLSALRGGVTPPPQVSNARQGAAEVLYGLGSAIGADDGPELPAAYLRLAIYLNPDSVLARMATGDLFQAAGQCNAALAIYETVPGSHPMRRNADIQIGNCLESLDRFDEAAAILSSVVDTNPADFEAAIELGNVYRLDERYEEAAEAYSRGIEHLPQEAGGAWRIYYFRGIAHERAKRWPEAEVDFHRALELNPNQPQVLNYLGYSWVDMGENLDPALDMIRTAVDLRPNDGYIVDSLGWAFYRLDRFDEAVVELERAVELRPEDPVINDHLGDAYWQVGRKREAVFQWAHARDLDPEEDELPLILAKIEHGLDAAPAFVEAATGDEEPRPETLIVAAGDSLWSLAARLFGDGNFFTRLLDANRDRIDDPDVIHPGMELAVPQIDAN